MKESVEIELKEPCHENWNAMQVAEQGRFCNACQKQVVDFTCMTDQQIIDFMNKASGNGCGRFTGSQLNRPLQPVRQTPKAKWWFSLLLPSMLLIEKSVAQNSTGVVNSKKRKMEQKPVQNGQFIEAFVNVKGRVVNHDGVPVQYASVKTYDGSVIAFTDTSGEFCLKIPAMSGAITIIASNGIGEIKTEVKLSKETFIWLKIPNQVNIDKTMFPPIEDVWNKRMMNCFDASGGKEVIRVGGYGARKRTSWDKLLFWKKRK